jgi:hypothetical protein
VAKTHYLQSSFTAGVLDPRLAARTDVRQFYQGMSVGRNVVTVPMGGVKRRPGLRYVLTLPADIQPVATAITITAPNGGTAANANDVFRSTVVLTTTNLSTTNPYVVVQYDLGSAKEIFLAAVRDIKVTAGSASSEFLIQFSNDASSWTVLPNPQDGGPSTFEVVDTIPSSYVRGVLGSTVTARYWRVVRISGSALPDLGTAKAQLSEFTLYETTPTLSAVRLIPFERSDTERYVIALNGGFATVVGADGAIVCIVPTDYARVDLADIDAAQSADTMVIVHEDYAPARLVRESSTNWQLSALEFVGLPQYDFDDASSPAPTSEVQTLVFTSFAEGNTFQLELNGARTGPIAYQPTSTSTTAENIRRALQKLYTVGFTGVSVEHTSGTTYTVTFAEESADNYDLMIGTTLTGSGTIAAATTTNGVARREPVWSATRGYPRTVTFHEGRLWFGGTRSLLQAYLASVVNDPFNFETGEGLADDAIFGLLNTAQLNSITAIKSGRFLHMFTTGGEFRFTASPISPSDMPRNQTEYGTAKIRPVSVDGSILYVQRTRKVLRDFLYSYEEDAYSSAPLSVLASHLLTNVVDVTAWQGSDDDDANYVFLVNGDGTIAVYNTLRSQEISAFTTWDTHGTFKAVGAAGADRYFAVQRSVNGANVQYLEIADDSYFTDSSVQHPGNGVGATFPVVNLTGESVRVRADDFVLDAVTVNSSGNVVLSTPPAATFEAGLDFTVEITTMPLNSDFGNGGNYLRKKRIVKMRCHVYRSLGLRYNGRPLADRFFDQNSFDTAPEPYTGVHSLEESSNWDEGPLTQTFTQVDPLPLHLLGVDFTVESAA